MRFYREKCLAVFMEKIDDWLPSIMIQKLLFLLCESQDNKIYDFMPYKYGCYSMQLSQDLRNLVKDGYLLCEEDGTSHKYKISRNDLGLKKLIEEEDNLIINKIIRRYSDLQKNDLIKHIYLNYPFFSINSVMAKELLSENELFKINRHRPHNEEKTLMTIGYEGLSLEKYMVILIKNDVHVLCDVRKNAYSQKFGFSKAQLEKACEGTKIKYIHLPNLGIITEKRKDLKEQSDYDILFDEYETTTLLEAKDELNYLYKLLQKENRIALTCFEKDPKQCHRSRIAKKLMSIPQCNYTLKNLRINGED